MNFQEVDERLLKRKWCRADYFSYWIRRGNNAIDLRVGWQSRRSQYNGERVLRLYRDGRVTMSAHLPYPCYRYRFNRHMPFQQWYVTWYKHRLILHQHGQPWEKGKVIHPTHFWYSRRGRPHRKRLWHPRYIHFNADGSLRHKLRQETVGRYKRRYIKRANQRNRQNKRAWYWTTRARNLYLDTSKCVYHKNGHIDWSGGGAWDNCVSLHERLWHQPPARTYRCGCRTYRKKQKPFKKTISDIQGEQDLRVRWAWIQMYGLLKFFDDADDVHLLGKLDDYKLLEARVGPFQPFLVIRALTMVCPTTGDRHIHTVPLHMWTVPAALDWIYDVPDFIHTTGRQT